MPDQIFEDPRLVEIYDTFDGDRNDLQHYLKLVEEMKAHAVLDIGCGTGCFANLLAERGIEVIGVDPAMASLNIARRKSNAEKIRWIHGDAGKLPPMTVDLAVMTGNVAQVFLSDESWKETITAIRNLSFVREDELRLRHHNQWRPQSVGDSVTPERFDSKQFANPGLRHPLNFSSS